MDETPTVIDITCSMWMLEDLRARAQAKNTTVTDWLLRAVSLQRFMEDKQITQLRSSTTEYELGSWDG